MAHKNEYRYLEKFLREWPVAAWPPSLANARLLNCGSAQVDGAIDYRPLFPDRELVGCDLAAGPGVDAVCDLTNRAEVEEAFGKERFAAILCCSVLEHCERPWIAAEVLQERLLPEGLLYVSVPWTWRWHGYANDYWRMSPDGVRVLFPDVQWKRIASMTQAIDEIVPDGRQDDPPWRLIQGQRAYLTSQMTCMIGRRR